jgi:hypothetical protein
MLARLLSFKMVRDEGASGARRKRRILAVTVASAHCNASCERILQVGLEWGVRPAKDAQ